MTAVLLFHHAQGLTDGVRWFADELRAAGHQVAVPDLYNGATFSSLDDGVAHAEEVGFYEIIARGVAASTDLPAGAVVAGFSLGVLPAQKLAQTRPGVRGAVLLHSAVPSSEFDGPWPAGVALQLHLTAEDERLDPGELDAAEALAAEAADGTLYVYPGTGHLIADNSLPEFEPESAALILSRTKEFLDRMN
jgi:dienelactone hydrolase